MKPSFRVDANWIHGLLPESAASGRLRISLIRAAGGLYAPSSNDVEVFVNYKPAATSMYPVNNNGLVLTSTFPVRLPIWALPGIKSCNALPYVLAAKYANENGVDDTIIFNQNGAVAEASSSNIFLIKKGSISTTDPFCGAIQGVLQKVIINTCKDLGIPVIRKVLYKEDVLEADEVFLTNSIQGMRWVGSIDGKTYVNEATMRLNNLLLEHATRLYAQGE